MSFSRTSHATDELIEWKNHELTLIQNDLIDVTNPAIGSSQLSLYIIEMLSELNEFQRKNGLTNKVKRSKDRLMKMLDIIGNLDKLTSNNITLKSMNGSLLRQIMDYKKQNIELNKKIESLTKVLDF